MPDKLLRLTSQPDLVERVYCSLSDAICSGSLPPGMRITQEQIATQLAVSRQPVLQALRLLKQDGLVHDAPGRGLVIAPLDAAQLRSVYQVRGALDGLAARLAAQARVAMDTAQMACWRGRSASDDLQAMIEADLAFHQHIYQATGNPVLQQIADHHWRHIRRAMGVTLRMGESGRVWDEHQAIAQAIAAGDEAAATRLSEDHALRAGDELFHALTQVLKPASGESR